MAITNFNEMRSHLCVQMERVASGAIKPAVANASSNLSSKIISSIKVELECSKFLGKSPAIKFLNQESKAEKKLKKN
jgi:hypothetical protein